MLRPNRDAVGPGQTSVWDHPRPPSLAHESLHVRVSLGGSVVAETRRPALVRETSHPPVYFIAPEDIVPGVLRDAAGGSFCEWKGRAHYFDICAGGVTAERAAFGYRDPVPAFASITGWVAFYAGLMDEVTVEGERITPQPGGFYAGWITSDLAGPFKGGPGSHGW